MATDVISLAALNVLLAGIERYEARKTVERLATERSQAAYGETAETDIQIIAPVGAGNTK